MKQFIPPLVPDILPDLPHGAIYLGTGAQCPLRNFSGYFTGTARSPWVQGSYISGERPYYHYATTPDVLEEHGYTITTRNTMDIKKQYLEAQKHWVETYNVRPGDEVRILRPFKDNELGFGNGFHRNMESMVGATCTVRTITPFGIGMREGYGWPWFVLEKVGGADEKPFPLTELPMSRYSVSYEADGFRIGCNFLCHDDVVTFVDAYNAWNNE